MNKNTYQIEMSSRGDHKVTVVIEDPNGTDAALAWASATYAKLLRDAGSDYHRSQIDNAVPEQLVPNCQIHHHPMVQVLGRHGSFWSCHQKNQDGSWCSYRPSAACATS